MRELQFEGLSDDGSHMVLVDSRGVQYCLPIDDGIAAAARRGLQRNASRTAAPSITPRDIQALVRQGLGIEEVAARTGLAVDFVERFAEPVLAEMDFVIQRARRLSIHAAGQQVHVDDLVDRAARRADVPADELRWSCRKIEDATWRIDASTPAEDVLSLIFRTNEGTLAPADAGTADLLKGRRVVDVTDDGRPSLPQHWDAHHPAAKAAARSAQPAPTAAQAPLADDPSRIF